MNISKVERFILEKIRENNEKVGINASTAFNYLKETVPKKFDGEGTGNIQKYIFLLRDKGCIELTDSEIKSTGEVSGLIRLTAKGYEVFDPYWKKNWQIIVGVSVSIATIVTAFLTAVPFIQNLLKK